MYVLLSIHWAVDLAIACLVPTLFCAWYQENASTKLAFIATRTGTLLEVDPMIHRMSHARRVCDMASGPVKQLYYQLSLHLGLLDEIRPYMIEDPKNPDFISNRLGI